MAKYGSGYKSYKAYSKRRRYGKRKSVYEKIRNSIIAVAVLSSIIGYMMFAYSKTGTLTPTMELIDGKPSFRFIDVGQGDSTLVTWRGDSVLIDAGPAQSASSTAEYVRTYAPVLDYFIITHPHEDHMGGAAEILDTVEVKNLVMRTTTSDEAFYTNTIEKAEKNGTNIIYVTETCAFEAGDIYIGIMDIFDFDYESDLNNSSLFIDIEAGDTVLLITGDGGEDEEKYFIEHNLIDCDYLQAGHHGSKTSSSAEFLRAVTPEICVFSVGKANSYGHPSAEVLSRVSSADIDIRRTDREGNVVLRGK